MPIVCLPYAGFLFVGSSSWLIGGPAFVYIFASSALLTFLLCIFWVLEGRLLISDISWAGGCLLVLLQLWYGALCLWNGLVLRQRTGGPLRVSSVAGSGYGGFRRLRRWPRACRPFFPYPVSGDLSTLDGFLWTLMGDRPY
jgi:hypothetical protein